MARRSPSVGRARRRTVDIVANNWPVLKARSIFNTFLTAFWAGELSAREVMALENSILSCNDHIVWRFSDGHQSRVQSASNILFLSKPFAFLVNLKNLNSKR